MCSHLGLSFSVQCRGKAKSCILIQFLFLFQCLPHGRKYGSLGKACPGEVTFAIGSYDFHFWLWGGRSKNWPSHSVAFPCLPCGGRASRLCVRCGTPLKLFACPENKKHTQIQSSCKVCLGGLLELVKIVQGIFGTSPET